MARLKPELPRTTSSFTLSSSCQGSTASAARALSHSKFVPLPLVSPWAERVPGRVITERDRRAVSVHGRASPRIRTLRLGLGATAGVPLPADTPALAPSRAAMVHGAELG